MDRYSRSVRFLKVLLPLAALGLLSTLFLLSRNITPEATIPFADNEIAERLRDQQVTEPFFSGVTKNGGQIIVTASVASPLAPGKPAQAKDLQAQVTTLEGLIVKMRSSEGMLEDANNEATFLGDVVMETSSGYRIETEELKAALSGLSGEAPGAIQGQGPPGRFEAGAMRLFSENEGGAVHTHFKNGVKLIYDPKEIIE